MKHLNELSKEEKILLLSAISNGRVRPESVHGQTVFAFAYSDFFEGLMISATAGVPVICLGESVKAMKDMDRKFDEGQLSPGECSV